MHESKARTTARPEKSVGVARAAAPLDPVFDVLEVVGDEPLLVVVRAPEVEPESAPEAEAEDVGAALLLDEELAMELVKLFENARTAPNSK